MCKRVLIFCGLLLSLPVAGCSGSPSDAGCVLDYFGNTADSERPARCATLTAAGGDAGAAAGWQLTISNQPSSAASKLALLAAIDLGPAPGAGTYSSETVGTWSITALSTAASNCAFGAGASSVPTGSFTLQLASVDLATAAVHGTLEAQMTVHAPPGTDCGPGDEETADVRF
ncbi:MAG TPA: hypothetical protein VMT03_09635 [Polyangia bacterium]|nr:hypothetical protein [Polyangia bacterium]